ncbi:MAG TPA: alpha/beta fold hydrolase [Amycolatopsis sp.]|uniref:thioesterase II family protein n=1 Tax=Amycolatopsis sp. TaxID=37632 RepID=UPI002B49A119|nr:alpha/beta fold hydrolase [Amycolatopsis sp.]HKS47102.1 alpha/beta fold hydrolase [Amycolatopsis sp.]
MTLTAQHGDGWIRRFHPAPDATARLVCFPHAGGSASFYFPLSRALPGSVEVLAVQYPGRQDRRSEKCVESIRELADDVAERLREWADRPIVLFGHSMGATVAFEVAGRLGESGVVPAGLFVSGRRAPSRHRSENVHRRPDEGLLAELRSVGGTEARLLDDAELLTIVLPMIRSDYKAAETYRYRPRPRLTCPIVALVGDRDPKVTIDEARAWDEHTTSTFEMEVFSGGHFYLTEHLPGVVAVIQERLASLESRGIAGH